MEDKKIKHLEMIEAIISRMADNSFKLKGWAIAIVSLVGTLLSLNQNKIWLFILMVPIVAFWFMDAKYLQQERLFRRLYDQVRLQKEDEIDFSMNVSTIKVSATDGKLCFCNCLFSWSEVLFYAFIMAGVTGLYFILR